MDNIKLKITKNGVVQEYVAPSDDILVDTITCPLCDEYFYGLIDGKMFEDINGAKFFPTEKKLKDHMFSCIHHYRWKLSDYPGLSNDGCTEINVKDLFNGMMEAGRIQVKVIKMG